MRHPQTAGRHSGFEGGVSCTLTSGRFSEVDIQTAEELSTVKLVIGRDRVTGNL